MMIRERRHGEKKRGLRSPRFQSKSMDALNAVANRFLAQDEDGGALPTLPPGQTRRPLRELLRMRFFLNAIIGLFSS